MARSEFEKFAAAVDKAVIIELDGLFHAQHRLDRPVHALQADRIVEIRSGIKRIELPWRWRTAWRRADRASPRNRPCRDRSGAASWWNRGQQPFPGSGGLPPSAPSRMMASPRPKRASGSAESSSIARSKASRAILVRNSVSAAKPKTRCTRSRSGARLNTLFCRFVRAVAVAEHEPHLAEPRPGKRILRL